MSDLSKEIDMREFREWENTRVLEKSLIKKIIWDHWDFYNGVDIKRSDPTELFKNVYNHVLSDYKYKLIGSCYNGYVEDLVVEFLYRKKIGLNLED